MKITGLSIQDILSMSWKEIDKLSLDDMKKLSMRLNSAANKRLKRVEASGDAQWSPAVKAVEESGGKFSVKGLTTKAEVKSELQRAGSFLAAKTSTVTGTRKHKRTIEKLVTPPEEQKKLEMTSPVTEPASVEMSESARKTLFRALDRLRETNAALVHNIGSDVIIKEIRKSQMAKRNRNRFQLAKDIERKFPELTESSEARYVREEEARQARTAESGAFYPLSSDESNDNPFTT